MVAEHKLSFSTKKSSYIVLLVQIQINEYLIEVLKFYAATSSTYGHYT
jgi:hypothetical protein